MELVSLALGVLPVLGAAIHGWQAMHRKFTAFRHYSRELQRVYKQVDRQSHFFNNEIHLLLRSALADGRDIELMLKDPGHSKWISDELEVAMRKNLGTNYDVCLGLIEDVNTAMESLAILFTSFDEVIGQRRENETLREAVRRLRGRVKISYDQVKFEQCLKDLRESNDDLRRLRNQAHEINGSASRRITSAFLDNHPTPEYEQLCTTRRASSAFHEALEVAWSRVTGVGSSRHMVRLFLGTQVKEDVYMDVVISCCGHGFADKYIAQEKLTKLQVRTQVRGWAGGEGENHGNAAHDGRKRRRVRFLDQSERDSPVLEDSLSSDSADPPVITDLSSEDFCSSLHKSCSLTSNPDSSASCLGYIDSRSEGSFRHRFYRTTSSHDQLDTAAASTLMSMSEVLEKPAETTFSIVQQLKLARNLVTAVLKFHSTPWLREYFSLSNLSFFRHGQDLEGSLDTLHVGSDFIQPSIHIDASSQSFEPFTFQDSWSVEMETAMEHAKLQYGIRNVTLWSLGTILLQIGRWSKLEAPGDVSSIRRMASQVSSLGPRYRGLTKKCLECDFGFGEDLSEQRPKQAVYEGLVCELSGIIGSLS